MDSGLGQIDIHNDQLDDISKSIESTFLKSASKNIPRGSVKKFKPFWTKELEETVHQRRKARKAVEKDATPANKTAYNRLTAKVRYLSRTGRRSRWHDTCDKLDLNRDGHKVWKLLENLEGSKRKENPKPFIHEGQKVTSGKKKADIFNTYLAGVSKSTGRKHLDKTLWKLFKRN